MASRVSALRFRHQILILLASIIVMMLLAFLLVAVPALISSEKRLAYERLQSVNNLKTLWILREFDEVQRGLGQLASNGGLVDELRFITKLLPQGGGDVVLRRRLRNGDRGEDPLAGDKLSLMWQTYDRMAPNFRYIDSSYPGSQILLVRPTDDLVLYSLHHSEQMLRTLDEEPGLGEAVSRCYQRATQNPGRVVFEDFESSLSQDSSGTEVRGCAATLLSNDDEPLAVLIHQFSAELINGIMSLRLGLGESGESYLVGKDKLLRTESRFFGAESILKQFADNRAVREGLSGFGGNDEVRDYRGQPAFAVWQPIAIDAISWSIITKLDEDEVYQELRDNATQLVLFLWLGVGVLFIIAYWFARGTERPLLVLLKNARRLADGDYSESVDGQAGSRELTDLMKTFRLMAQQVRERTGALDRARTRAERASVEAERANEAKSEFLSRMSHELRTPLNGVLGYAQILKRDEGISGHQLETLQAIESCGQHLLELINDVLDLSRIESGHLELNLEPCITRQLVDRVVAVVQPRALEKGLEFSVEAQDLPLSIVADAMKLRQVMINLLGNAIKFTDGGFVRMQVSAEPEEQLLHVSVSDSGVGIPKDQIEEIFSPFGQTAEGRQAGGTGLGLSISRRLCNAMGCELEVVSEPGQGTEFLFSLPYTLIDASEAGVDLAQGKVPVLADNQQVDVIVADDNRANRDILVQLMEAAGFTTRQATNGQEVLDLLEKSLSDLVLMDIRMPVMDGLEATRQIRSHPAWQAIPVLAVSATVQPEVVDEAAEAGCDAFLSKPVEVPALFEQIQSLLGLAGEANEAPPSPAGLIAELDEEGRQRALQLVQSLERAASLGDVRAAREAQAGLQQLPALEHHSRQVAMMIDAFNLAQLAGICTSLRQELEAKNFD